jgi:poly-gamma-glutamate synthesis protein (capsule biosynthesis protein)
MKKMNCDVKILSLHRGAEYRLSPNQRQKELAHSLIDNGADLILGGHSHIPGEYERYNGKYIFYSLGNFIFDQ